MTTQRGEERSAKALSSLSSDKILGEFEYMVLIAVLNLRDDAYGAKISEFLLRKTGRDIALAQVYVTLRRLEKKGLLISRMTTPRPVKGGRSRKVFELGDRGARVLSENTAIRSAMVAAHKENITYESGPVVPAGAA